MKIAWMIVCFGVTTALAQQSLKLKEPVGHQLSSGSVQSRNAELTPNPKFADFLAKELAPWIHAHYNVTDDPGKTVVAGSSLGGLAAVYAGYKHPEVSLTLYVNRGRFGGLPIIQGPYRTE
jgi:enterochelin esterase-like enzyme